MSGIAGIIRFDGAPVEPGLVEKMTSSMDYRGPDGIRHWVRGSVALGQCMLRTTPESLEETQPLANEDESLVLVMDGRVDNWEELRRELLGRGAVLRTRADAELVLRAYEAWGRECLAHIDGDFALVIWDARRREAFCARDRMGHKPFNYCFDGQSLIFASEVHAILALPAVPRLLNEGLLAEYLANEWLSRDETFWRGITRLVAAHRLTVDARGAHADQYWEPDLWSSCSCRSDEEWVEHYRELLADVVRRQSRSHHPVAFEVSGGLDSSALFAVAENLQRGQMLPAPAVQAYTLDFSGAGDADEVEYARAVVRHLGVSVREVRPSRLPLEWYRDWAESHLEFPGYPNGTMAVELRQAARRNDCRVVMAGVGGDEWLGMPRGGAYYAEELAAHQWRNVAACLNRDVRQLGPGKALWWLLRDGLAPLLPAALKHRLRGFRSAGSRAPLVPGLLAEVLARRRLALQNSSPTTTKRLGQAFLFQVLRGAYNALARELEERLSASLQVELRLPYYSPSIVQFAFSMPERLRSRGRTTKWLHRQALQGLLPAVVLSRSTKADFMETFRTQLDAIPGDWFRQIVQRRSAWIAQDRALYMWAHYRDTQFAGWSEWWLWTLVGCELLLYDVSA